MHFLGCFLLRSLVNVPPIETNNNQWRNKMEPKRILHEMKIRGITQKKLAEKLGVRPQSVSMVVCGKKNICRIRQAIADAIEQPIDAIFSFDCNPKKTKNNQ